LLFWQGGFLFYSTVVIPIGREVLGSIRQQARITRQATFALNLAGGVALAALAWDVLALPDPGRARVRGRSCLWVLLLSSLLFLVWLRSMLDRQFNPTALEIAEPVGFTNGHQVYIGVSILQTVLALGLLVLTLRAWRAVDQRCGEKK
jgi:hypothetical protein